MPPLDKTQDVRADMVATMLALGIDVEVHHHEVGGGAQAEIDLKYKPLLEMCDAVGVYKYVVKNVAQQHGLIATFMPKPSSRRTAPACTCTRACGRTARRSSSVMATPT